MLELTTVPAELMVQLSQASGWTGHPGVQSLVCAFPLITFFIIGGVKTAPELTASLPKLSHRG